MPLLVAVMLAALLAVTQTDDEASDPALDQVLSWGGLLVAAIALFSLTAGG